MYCSTHIPVTLYLLIMGADNLNSRLIICNYNSRAFVLLWAAHVSFVPSPPTDEFIYLFIIFSTVTMIC